MADIQIKINGTGQLNSYLMKLPSNITKQINMAQADWCSFVQKSIKLRMPKITGAAAALTTVSHPKKNTYKISMDAPYTYFILNNWKPHWIHADMDTRMGQRVGDVLGKEGFIFVKPRNKDILNPAIASGLAKLPEMLNRAVTEAIK